MSNRLTTMQASQQASTSTPINPPSKHSANSTASRGKFHCYTVTLRNNSKPLFRKDSTITIESDGNVNIVAFSGKWIIRTSSDEVGKIIEKNSNFTLIDAANSDENKNEQVQAQEPKELARTQELKLELERVQKQEQARESNSLYENKLFAPRETDPINSGTKTESDATLTPLESNEVSENEFDSDTIVIQ